MPSLHHPSTTRQELAVEFVIAPGLDLLNAMYFTFLANDYEGVGAWPIATRAAMDPALRDEMDALFNYPRVEPGILGALTDTTFLHREAWGGIEDLLRYVRDLPAGGSAALDDLGIQGLAAYALRWPGDDFGIPPPGYVERPSRAQVEAAVAQAGVDVERTMALYDETEEVRARMLRLIRRFYDEHYRRDEERRLACMRRSVEAHRNESGDAQVVMDRLSGRHIICLTSEGREYQRGIFAPSVDVGVYNSCADTGEVHGFFYACEPQFMGLDSDEDAQTQRMAEVYKALGDPQRLRILRLLADQGELYAQQIVDATGISQSVISRQLQFLRAVGLVEARRQNNMKFFSLNRAMRDELRDAVDAFIPPA